MPLFLNPSDIFDLDVTVRNADKNESMSCSRVCAAVIFRACSKVKLFKSINNFFGGSL